MEKETEAVGKPLTRPLLQDASQISSNAGRRAREFARIDADVKGVSHGVLSGLFLRGRAPRRRACVPPYASS